jgi:glutathione S-transferase
MKPITQEQPILYSFRRCPYAIRARMALKYSGISVYLREIILRNKPPALLKCSAKGTVPVLVLKDNTIIDESREIMQWSLAINDPEQWLPEHQVNQIMQLIDHNDFDFKTHLDHYKYADRHPEHSAEYYRSQGEQFLQLLDNHLTKHQYLFGNKVSLADIAIFPFIRQFANVDTTWFYKSQYQQLQDWLDGFLQSQAFIAVMDKYTPWTEYSSVVVF